MSKSRYFCFCVLVFIPFNVLSYIFLIPFYVLLRLSFCIINGILIRLQNVTLFFLTSSLRTPKIFIKEFGDFLMSCHQHCLGVNLLVQR